MEELKRLENDMKASEELYKNLDEAFRRIAAEGKAQNDGEIMVAAAKELGYDITIAALEQAKAEVEQLDLEALEAVAGGETSSDDPALLDEYGHSQWCVVAWHCFTAAIHTQSEEKKLACWSDYRCMSVNMGGLIEW